MAFYFDDLIPSAGVPSGGSSSETLANYGAQYGIAPGAGMAPSIDDPPLWMGQQKKRVSEHTALSGRTYSMVTQDLVKPLSQVLAEFDSMKPEDHQELAVFLSLAGYLPSGKDFAETDEIAMLTPLTDVRSAYEALLNDTLTRQSALKQRVTPMDILQRGIAYRLSQAGVKWDGNLNSLGGLLKLKSLGGPGLPEEDESKKPGGANFTGTIKQTSTSRSVNLINPEDAKNLTRSMLQQQLGRDPSQAEYEDFLSMLHAAERAQPDVTTATQTSRYRDGMLVHSGQSSTTRQGIGAAGLEQLAYERAQRNPDWAEWQAVGVYAPALFEALSSPVSV